MDQNKSHTKTGRKTYWNWSSQTIFSWTFFPNSLNPHRPTRRHCFYRKSTAITDYTFKIAGKLFITVHKPLSSLIKGLQLRSFDASSIRILFCYQIYYKNWTLKVTGTGGSAQQKMKCEILYHFYQLHKVEMKENQEDTIMLLAM